MKKIFVFILLFSFFDVFGNGELHRSVSRKGTFIAFKKENKVRVFNTIDGSQVFGFTAPKPIWAVAFSNSEEYFTFVDEEMTMHCYNLTSGSEMWKSEMRKMVEINRLTGLMLTYTYDDQVIVAFILKGEDLRNSYSEVLTIDAYAGEMTAYNDYSGNMTAKAVIQTRPSNRFVVYDYQGTEHAHTIIDYEGYGEMRIADRHHKNWHDDHDIESIHSRDVYMNDYTGTTHLSFVGGKKLALNIDGAKKYKSYDIGEINVKVSANQQYLLVHSEGKAEISKFNPSGGLKEKEKYVKRDDFSKAAPGKVHKINLDIGEQKIPYWDGTKIIAADLENYVFTTYDPANGKQLGKYEVAESFKSSGATVAGDYKKANPGVYFADTFIDNELLWEIRKDHENYQGDIVDGVFKPKKGGSRRMMLTHPKMKVDMYRDFQIEMQLKGQNGQYGIFWGMGPDSKVKNELLFNGNGQYAMTKSDRYNRSYKSLDWKDYTPSEDGFDKVQIKYKGNEYTFAINGLPLTEGLIPPSGFGSDLGVIYDPNADVELTSVMLSYWSTNVNKSSSLMYVEFDNPMGWMGLSRGSGKIENSTFVVENGGTPMDFRPKSLGDFDSDENLIVEYDFVIEGDVKVLQVKELFECNSTRTIENLKSGERNSIMIYNGRYYVNDKLVEYGEKEQSIRIPSGTTMRFSSIKASYIHPDHVPRSSSCRIFLLIDKASGAASKPVACRSTPTDYNFSKWMRENGIRWEIYDSAEIFELEWKDNDDLGRLNVTPTCTSSCN